MMNGTGSNNRKIETTTTNNIELEVIDNDDRDQMTAVSSMKVVSKESEEYHCKEQQPVDVDVGDEDTTATATATDTDTNEDWTIQRDIHKYEGDMAYRKQQYHSAIHYYSMALSLDPTNGTILCNRSASYLNIHYHSKAYVDGLASIPSMGNKGKCRTAAALQAMHRYDEAVHLYQAILDDDPKYTAAITGLQYCRQQTNQKQQQQKKQDEEEEEDHKEEEAATAATDDLDDFFNDVEDVVQTTVYSATTTNDNDVDNDEVGKKATDAILNHKKELGSVREQVERLTKPNYTWYNLNPFHVLDLNPMTTNTMDISRRYKALSLLLHPDRYHTSAAAATTSSSSDGNTTTIITKEQVQLAYDQVLIAKATLDNDDKVKHIRDLIEQGMNQGKVDYEKQQQQQQQPRAARTGMANTVTRNDEMTLVEHQNRAIHRIFATIEYTRQQVLERERSFYQKEQESSDLILSKERNSRSHDVAWQQSDRVDTRIGDWRSFQSTTKKAKKT